jgi:hypothetical protein
MIKVSLMFQEIISHKGGSMVPDEAINNTQRIFTDEMENLALMPILGPDVPEPVKQLVEESPLPYPFLVFGDDDGDEDTEDEEDNFDDMEDDFDDDFEDEDDDFEDEDDDFEDEEDDYDYDDDADYDDDFEE